MTAICCPGHVPCADHRKTKSEVIAELQAARAERDQLLALVAAIGELVDPPYPHNPKPPTGDIDASQQWFEDYKRHAEAYEMLRRQRVSAVEAMARRPPQELTLPGYDLTAALRRVAGDVTYPTREGNGADT